MRAVTFVLLGLVSAGCRTAPLPSGGGDAGGVVDMAGAQQVCTASCTVGLTCCGNNQCVNTQNDVFNCGGCGIVCTGPAPFCDGTKCAPAPCSPACTGGQLCCVVNGPGPQPPAACTAPSDAGTCPIGCPLCQ